ncbi:MAG TPA: hypothetical protein VG498_10305 [Terriglobales bacterium]|nr:hypothetical protein [Terriglobales bacterium]
MSLGSRTPIAIAKVNELKSTFCFSQAAAEAAPIRRCNQGGEMENLERSVRNPGFCDFTPGKRIPFVAKTSCHERMKRIPIFTALGTQQNRLVLG